jgi:hypothetical protein
MPRYKWVWERFAGFPRLMNDLDMPPTLRHRDIDGRVPNSTNPSHVRTPDVPNTGKLSVGID